MRAVPQSGTTLGRLGSAAILMTSAVLVSRVIGYGREAFVAWRFGANAVTDAFYAAFTIPDWLNYLVAGGTLSVTLLPVYGRHLAAGDEDGANRALMAVTQVLVPVLVLGVVAGEVLAAPLTRLFFHRMGPAAVADCVRFTRVLLPAQICFVTGGVFSATLLARGRFLAAAVAPTVYNLGIILGGALFGGRLGAASLAWGALAGAFAGPLLVPAVAAVRAGARLRPTSLRSAALSEWLRLTLPLMVGVTLVSADEWIVRYFAGADAGAITRLNYARRLVAVPIAVAGQAIGQASLPFFVRLWSEGAKDALADTYVATARGAAVVSILVAAWMAALAEPIVDLLFRRGHFGAVDVGPTAVYLAVFAVAVPLWSVQGLAARLFYAARNTWTPMVAGTVVTLASLPVYFAAYRAGGAVGLAAASGIGIALHTLALLALSPRILPELRDRARPAVAGVLRGAILGAIAGGLAHGAARLVREVASGRSGDLLRCAVGTLVFAGVVAVGARPLDVNEPRAILRRVAGRVTRASDPRA
jgi:putative peptidoglycan lipid II flippase